MSSHDLRAQVRAYVWEALLRGLHKGRTARQRYKGHCGKKQDLCVYVCICVYVYVSVHMYVYAHGMCAFRAGTAAGDERAPVATSQVRQALLRAAEHVITVHIGEGRRSNSRIMSSNSTSCVTLSYEACGCWAPVCVCTGDLNPSSTICFASLSVYTGGSVSSIAPLPDTACLADQDKEQSGKDHSKEHPLIIPAADRDNKAVKPSPAAASVPGKLSHACV